MMVLPEKGEILAEEYFIISDYVHMLGNWLEFTFPWRRELQNTFTGDWVEEEKGSNSKSILWSNTHGLLLQRGYDYPFMMI